MMLDGSRWLKTVEQLIILIKFLVLISCFNLHNTYLGQELQKEKHKKDKNIHKII